MRLISVIFILTMFGRQDCVKIVNKTERKIVMLYTGISTETGNPVTGYLIKDQRGNPYIFPSDKTDVQDGKVKGKLVPVEVFSEKGITPFKDAAGYPICVGDIVQIRTSQIGAIEIRDDSLVWVTNDTFDCAEMFSYLTELWIIRNGAQVVGDRYAGQTKEYKKGYAYEPIL